MCWVYVCIGNGVDGLGLNVCEMREQHQGNKVREVRWTGMGLSVCVCVRASRRDRQKDHMFPLTRYQPALNAHRMSFTCII